jgi:hypothetical protein
MTRILGAAAAAQTDDAAEETSAPASRLIIPG